MHLDEEIRGDIAVVALRGELIDDEDHLVLQEKMMSLRLDGISKVVFDLGKVNRINSRGLSALIAAVKGMRSTGGDVRFVQIDGHLNEIFVRTRLVQVFNTYETVGRALASFSTNPSPAYAAG